jgi:hypothetical protein
MASHTGGPFASVLLGWKETMVDAVGTVGLTNGTALRAAVAAASTSTSTASATTGTSQVQRISPTIKSDPMSGVLITEYLSANGDVRMQIPSDVVVAYLRSGLTSTGQVRPDKVSVGAEA